MALSNSPEAATLPADLPLASCGGLQPVEHLLGVDDAGLLLDEAALREDGEVRDAAHVVTSSELRVGFGVDLEDDAAPRDLACGALHVRRSHAAGTAPRCPEVDKHGNVCIVDDVVEARDVGGDGFGDRRERLFAVAAAAGVSEMRRGNAVLRSAVRAASNEGHG